MEITLDYKEEEEKIITDEFGTLVSPITYNGNIVLEKDKYYKQDELIYICIEDSIDPVHDRLHDLIGIYVDLI